MLPRSLKSSTLRLQVGLGKRSLLMMIVPMGLRLPRAN